MGHGWRRVMETVRQKVVTDRAFQPTSNARNEAMFKEATDFCAHLRMLERDLRGLHKEIDGKFVNLRLILSSPLPRAYDEGQNGAVPCVEEPKLIGQGITVDVLHSSANELRMRLEEEVLKPLRSWLQAYRTVCERMENLERLRLELDSRRRTVDGLRDKLDRLKDTQPPAKEKEKHDQELEKTTQMLQHKREKQDRTASAFQELEQTVFNSLNTLIKDTGVLRDYTGLSLSILQDCFQKSHAAFSTATPLLDYNSTSDNMFNHQQSAYQHQHLPVIEKAQSERALMVRQLADRPAAAPGTAKGGGMPMYGADDLGGDANMPYGIDQQVHAAPVAPMGAYPDVPQPVGPSGANGNPYAGAYQSPNATRYFQPMQY